MPKPPVNPEGMDKVNFVIDSWTSGCDAPWYIYIETMGPAALEAFIMLISFGWADVIRGALRPKGLGRRSTKKKGRWGRRIPHFPEPGNTLGKWLPFAEQVEDFANWGTKTKFLWRIDNAVQGAFFYWLVADVAEDFVFNWTSLLYETEWCKQPQPGGFSAHRVGNQSKSGGSWHKENYPEIDWQNPFPSWIFATGFSGSTGCTVAASAAFAPFGLLDPPSNVGIRVKSDTSPDIFGQTDPQPPQDPANPKVPVKCQVPPGRLFRVETYHDAPWAKVGNGVVVGVQYLET